MKKWQLCVTGAVVLTGLLFSTIAQAAGTPTSTSRRAHVEVFDVQPSVTATCLQHGPMFDNLLDTVDLQEKNLAARLREEATAALLQQGLLVIELPGHARPVSLVPADTDAKLISAVEE